MVERRPSANNGPAMSVFVDKTLLQMSDSSQLSTLLAPASDTQRITLKRLFSAVYELPFATLDSVKSFTVDATEFARPLFPPTRRTGTWVQTAPTQARTEVEYEESAVAPEWVDCLADLTLTVVLDADDGAVDSLTLHAIENFTSVAEFKAHFAFFDVDAFMAEHDLHTAEDLKEAFDYFVGALKLKTPPPFDPNSPASEHRFPLRVAFLIRDTIDMAASLRDAKGATAYVQRAVAYRRESGAAEVRTPYAVALVFPVNALPPGVNATQLTQFFAGERITVLFREP